MQKRAVVLVSGGLDSATVLAIARDQGYDCFALAFDYGQRHRVELKAAERVAQAQGAVDYKVIQLDLTSIGGSALTDQTIAVPDHSDPASGTQPVIPVTYVPARNTVFLSIALGWAEVLAAEALFIGVNAVDYSGYPDCRPQYLAAFQNLANLATRAGVEGHALAVQAPLLHLSKADIIQRGVALGVDYGLTVSCYQADADGRACGHCDSCYLRRQGFRNAGVPDPTRYVA